MMTIVQNAKVSDCADDRHESSPICFWLVKVILFIDIL